MTVQTKDTSGGNGARDPRTAAANSAAKAVASGAKRAVSKGKASVPQPTTPKIDRDKAPRRAKKRKDGADGQEAPAGKTEAGRDLRAPELYLNRELTWLSFNERVLHEASDPRTPLLERVKFLAIVSSNIDEFFMKRIGGLKQQVGAGVDSLTVDGRTPQQQITECIEVIKDLQRRKRDVFMELIKLLGEQGIKLTTYDRLSARQREELRDQYLENIFPLVTPLAMDPAHPFPFISNLSTNLFVTLHHPNEQDHIMARVKVPVGAGVRRFMDVKANGTHYFVRLEDVMADNLDLLFPGMEIDSCDLFRVTRNANTEHDEDQADDLMAMIEAEMRDRKFAPIVRLQTNKGMDPLYRGMLASELGLDQDKDVFDLDPMIGMRDIMEIAALDVSALHDAPHHPVNNDKLHDERNIFHIIRESGPILLHHPYESFATSVERFVREASDDPKVLAIKMSLYRTSADTRIIESLIDAARNGKQVAVVVELKARFDETANIRWATRMEEVGIHVTYGVLGLKTHSKVVLVIRKDYSGLRRYAHIGTGNYHAGTARMYSDLGLLTCDVDIAKDLTELFNYLTTGCKPSRKYRKILAAPKTLKKPLLAKINREIALHSEQQPGLIRFKMNALEDADITEALYNASQAGVKVELIVRDTCRLRPGLPDLSENVTVVSIVGRFLEHSRIFYFRNGGEEEYFIGSADLMTRNLESRVEVVVPVEEPALCAELHNLLETQLNDRCSAWEMQPDGSYIQRQPEPGSKAKGCQEAFIARAAKRDFEMTRLRKRKPRSIARRSVG